MHSAQGKSQKRQKIIRDNTTESVKNRYERKDHRQKRQNGWRRGRNLQKEHLFLIHGQSPGFLHRSIRRKNWNLAGCPRGQFVTNLGQSTHNSRAPRPVLPRKIPIYGFGHMLFHQNCVHRMFIFWQHNPWFFLAFRSEWEYTVKE